MASHQKEKFFLPNFFLLGAAKSGTTTMYAYLEGMPDVCMSNPKEPRFFEAEYERGLEFYHREYFSHWRNEPVIGEAQHRNLYLPFVPRRIHAVNPGAKLLVILRNPVTRAHSHWFHYASRGREPLDFEQALRADLERIESGLPRDDPEEAQRWAKRSLELKIKTSSGDGLPLYRTYLDSGYYHEQLQRYLALYPRENLMATLFEDMVAHPQQVVGDIVKFLGLDEAVNRWHEPVWRNPATPDGKRDKSMRDRQNWLVRKTLRVVGLKRLVKDTMPAAKVYSSRPPIDPKVRQWLCEHYREPNRRLAELLDRDLSAWV